MRGIFPVFILVLLISSCVPKEPVVLRAIQDIFVETGDDGMAMLKGNAVFYNPNSSRMKLQEINVEVFVNGKKAAHADQQLRAIIPAKSQFSVPLEVKLSLKELGLVDTILSLLGGKKYELVYVGFIRIRFHGVNVKIPINFKDQIKLRI